MMHDTPGDSAASFFFKNKSCTDSVFSKSSSEETIKESISKLLKNRGWTQEELDGDKAAKMWVSIFSYSKEYSQLQAGSLHVIGVPKQKTCHFAYDAYSWGVPTGRIIEKDPCKRLSDPWSKFFLQARIMIHKDTLNPEFGVIAIDLHDEKEVEAFCEGVFLESPQVVYKDTGVFEKESTDKETHHQKSLIQMDQKVKSLAL